MQPMKMRPYFRHGEATPWGGTLLRDALGKPAPDVTGESLEVSALPGMESVIENGEFQGMTLAEALNEHYEEITGVTERPFPLLLKLLDARDMLSVQVHPGDEYARAHDGKLGKTEAWIVLGTEPGAKIAYGLKAPKEELRARAETGAFADALNWVTVAPGEVYYIPHGMVHALGGGIQVYEIQQSSDATYRIYDWGRLGKDGKPRETHMDKALDVVRPELAYSKIPGTTVLCDGGSRTYYVCNANFELMRLNVSGAMPVGLGRMMFITPLGACKLTWQGGELMLNPFETALIPACMTDVKLVGNLSALCAGLPDRDALKKELGYRAENVAGLLED